ncbi:MAG: hypothetical protein IPM16_15155 [Chloroflexi bacterium]|nr:hypothetical protein [Chloroflexota bacterium]
MNDYSTLRIREGQGVFQKAKRDALFQEIIGRIRGRPTELLSFEDIRARLRLNIQNYRGLQDVPLDKIVGSVGRYHEFTRTFLPRRGATEERWSRVYAQTIGTEGLPPIEVYKIDDVYFVRDGNHRVSVARQLGAKTIQAEVTELPTPIGLRPDYTTADLEAAACYAEFLQQAGSVFRTAPSGAFRLTHPAAYNELIGHINLYRCVDQARLECNLSVEEAADHWYNEVYQPVIQTIRAYGIMPALFPNCTETDLYLWVTEHLRECEEDLAGAVQPRPLNDFLLKFLSEHNIPIPAEARARAEDAAHN